MRCVCSGECPSCECDEVACDCSRCAACEPVPGFSPAEPCHECKRTAYSYCQSCRRATCNDCYSECPRGLHFICHCDPRCACWSLNPVRRQNSRWTPAHGERDAGGIERHFFNRGLLDADEGFWTPPPYTVPDRYKRAYLEGWRAGQGSLRERREQLEASHGPEALEMLRHEARNPRERRGRRVIGACAFCGLPAKYTCSICGDVACGVHTFTYGSVRLIAGRHKGTTVCSRCFMSGPIDPYWSRRQGDDE